MIGFLCFLVLLITDRGQIMVRKAHMVTKHGQILVNFTEGTRPPFCEATSDLLLRITPHQSSPLFDPAESTKRYVGVRCKQINAECVCVEKGLQSAVPNVQGVMSNARNSLLWLDPTQIPAECLASLFANWLRNVQSTNNTGLGIVIPSSDKTVLDGDSFRAWTLTSSGYLKREFREINLPVWYPSLPRKYRFLEEIAKAIEPFDIFPIVEFPQIIDYDDEKEIFLHHQLLDQYRTRTRNFIYLNNRSPEEALRTLHETFQVVPRSGKMPRSLVITPGGESISYLVTLLAGVLAEGTFITSEMEIPYSESRGTWGFAIFKKCE